MSQRLRIFYSFFLCGGLLGLFAACQTLPLTSLGIQPDFEGVTPASILAISPFFLPNPASAQAAIDPTVVLGDRISPLIEKAILRSFEHQPDIHGYSFAAVSQIIQNSHQTSSSTSSKNTLKSRTHKPPVALWNRMEASIKTVAARFSSFNIKDKLTLTNTCSSMENMVDFYAHCLLSDKSWRPLLNELSAKAFHADSALFVFVDDLRAVVEKKDQKNVYKNFISISVLLVDTNNGKLIWSQHRTNVASNLTSTFPSWSALVDHTLDEDFWTGFPGRHSSMQENSK